MGACESLCGPSYEPLDRQPPRAPPAGHDAHVHKHTPATPYLHCRLHIKWPLFQAKILQNAPVCGKNVEEQRPNNKKCAMVSETLTCADSRRGLGAYDSGIKNDDCCNTNGPRIWNLE